MLPPKALGKMWILQMAVSFTNMTQSVSRFADQKPVLLFHSSMVTNEPHHVKTSILDKKVPDQLCSNITA